MSYAMSNSRASMAWMGLLSCKGLLASHLYHRDWLLGCLNNPNSFIMNSSAIYRNDAVISYVNKSRPSLLLILGCLQSFTSVECLPMLLT